MQVADFITRCSPGADVEVIIRVDDIARLGAEVALLGCSLDVPTAQLDVITMATTAALATAVADAEVLCDIRDADNSSTMPCNLLQEDVVVVVRTLVRGRDCSDKRQHNTRYHINS